MRRKARLTITLSPDLVRRLDAMIDKRTVRSRSHAVETLLRQSFTPSVRTAVLLAGGRRDFMEVPALAPVQGRPVILRTIEHVMEAGVRSFVVLAGPHESVIRDSLGDGSEFGARIRYVTEDRALGTAGALKLAEPYLGGDPFLVVHADVLTDIDLESFIDFHFREKTLATMAVKPRQSEESYGKALLQGNRIVDFIERSVERGISVVNTGVYLFEPSVLSMIEDGRPTTLETDVFPKLAGMGELAAFFFQGIWFDIATPENLRLAEERLRLNGVARHVHTE